MRLSDQNVLFFTRTMRLGGTENVILQLCEILQTEVKSITVCSCGGVNVERLEKMGIKHYQIDDIECKNPKVFLRVRKRIKEIVKKENITIIHTHHRMAAFYVSVMRLYRSCVFLNTSHNTFTDKRFLTRFAYKEATIIACGEKVKRNLVEKFGLHEAKISVICNAVKAFGGDVIEDPFINMLKQDYVIVGNVGRISKQKGMEYFVQAIPKVLCECPKARFLIVGTGEEEQVIREMANKLEVGDKLFFLGYRNDIQSLMSQMDLIVLSSLWEGLPLTPIEAFSVGKTIVATSVDGTTEIVDDGINGLLVEPYNSSELADKISWLLKHDEEKKKMEINAYKKYIDKYTIDRLAIQYIQNYRELIKKHENTFCS